MIVLGYEGNKVSRYNILEPINPSVLHTLTV